MNSPVVASNPTTPRTDDLQIQPARWPAMLAGAALGVASLFALAATGKASSADCAALLFLAVVFSVAFYSRLNRHFLADTNGARDAATFALLAAMSVVYSLARRVEIGENVALRFALSGEDTFPISYAACAVVIAAPIAYFGHRRSRRQNSGNPVIIAMGATLGLLALLSLVSFQFLSRFYQVGAAAELDPTPLVRLLLQVVEFGAVTILCGVAMADLMVRRWVLRALPVLLWALWARHQFAAPLPEEAEEAE